MQRRACVALAAVAVFGLIAGCSSNPYRPTLFQKNQNKPMAGSELGAPTPDGPMIPGDGSQGMMIGPGQQQFMPGGYPQGQLPPGALPAGALPPGTLPPTTTQPINPTIPSFPPTAPQPQQQIPQGPAPVPQGPAPKPQPAPTQTAQG